jgi:hypothetical protein
MHYHYRQLDGKCGTAVDAAAHRRNRPAVEFRELFGDSHTPAPSRILKPPERHVAVVATLRIVRRIRRRAARRHVHLKQAGHRPATSRRQNQEMLDIVRSEA